VRLGDQVFRAAVETGDFDLSRGEAPDADATITSDPMALAAVLWEGYSLADAERGGDVTVEGDRRAAARFLKLFPLPEPDQAA
jgi:ubiquinone biosynthesis protein UbiJ